MKNYSQALKILKKAKIKIKEENIQISKSLYRINTKSIYSKTCYPLGNNSSLDGFAIKSLDTKKLNKKNYKIFKIAGSVAAGDKLINKKVKNFHVFEIMTGGLLPKGFDAIIPKEKIVFHPKNRNPTHILIDKKIRKYENVRFKGSDYKKNELIINKGTIVQPNHIMALKTLGVSSIKVKKIPKILFFATGNEITDKDKIPIWKIRNSNISFIESISKIFSFDLTYGGILKDLDDSIFKKKIKKILKSKIDIIITSGAVSEGKFDFIPNVIKNFNLSQYFKNVAIRPGKPILFAKFKNEEKAFFGLPGNSISSAACFRFFVYPYLKYSLGISLEKPFKANLKNGLIKNKKFTRFMKSRINTTKNGKVEVKILSGQESFRVKSFVNSNVWTVLPSGKAKFKKKDIVDCYFLNQPNNIFI